MSKRGKRIVDAKKAFSTSNQQIGSKLSRLIAAIRERKIGKRDFRLFRSFYDELESQFELFVGKAFR
ncbi:MAG: hypothetical protein AB8B83_03205, partial [Bdellovibrionales bacterium]